MKMRSNPLYAISVVFLTLALVLCLAFIYSKAKAQNNERLELLGGQTTIFNETPNAFGQPIPGLERNQQLLFFVGNSFFNQNWVTAPASTTARDGLGPHFKGMLELSF